MHMTPSRFRERLSEAGDRVDVEELVGALEYVRDDGRWRGPGPGRGR
jgi:hypothetical protein